MITLAQAKLAAAVAAIILLTTGVGTLVVYTALSPGRAPVATTNPAVTQPPMVPPPTTPRVLPAPSDAEVRAIVTKTLPEVRFDAVAFSDVMDFLRDITGASIFVNWRALEAARINKNTPHHRPLAQRPLLDKSRDHSGRCGGPTMPDSPGRSGMASSRSRLPTKSTRGPELPVSTTSAM